MLNIHPRSINFDWDACTVRPTGSQRITDSHWEQFVRDGYFVIENLLTPEEVQRITAETDHGYNEANEFMKMLPEERMFIAERGAISFAPHLALKSPVLREAVLNSPISEVARDIIGPEARLYHDQAVYKENEKPRRFPWHQDNGYTFVSPENYLTVWIALTDATVEAGCPWVAPGLQRHGTLVHNYVEPLGYETFEEPPVMPLAAPVKAGGAVVFSSLTPHLTGPNTSPSVRKAYIVQYIGNEATRFDNLEDSTGTPMKDDHLYPMIKQRGHK
jgi:ectoine hydroxylase-related dioxygenase (phytanoyl-CoA dioxygenase family)